MIWAGIMTDDRLDLYIFERGNVTVRYIDEMLKFYVRHFRDVVGFDLILICDNAKPHKAHLTYDFLETEDIRQPDLEISIRRYIFWKLWKGQLQCTIYHQEPHRA